MYIRGWQSFYVVEENYFNLLHVLKILYRFIQVFSHHLPSHVMLGISMTAHCWGSELPTLTRKSRKEPFPACELASQVSTVCQQVFEFSLCCSSYSSLESNNFLSMQGSNLVQSWRPPNATAANMSTNLSGQTKEWNHKANNSQGIHLDCRVRVEL